MSSQVSPGQHEVEIVGFGLEEATTGAGMFGLRFKVLNRIDANGKAQPCSQVERRYYQPLTHDWNVQRLIEDLGLAKIRFDSFEELHAESDKALDLIGKRLVMVCDRVWKEDREVETWGFRGKKLTIEGSRGLDSKFASVLAKARPNGPSA